MGLIAELAGTLSTGERLRFDLQRNGDGTLTLVVQPYFNTPVAYLDDATAPLRAALAMPLRVSGSMSSLDEDFTAMLREYGSRRCTVNSQLSALDALKEAIKAGERLQNDTKTHTKPTPQKAGSSETPVASTDSEVTATPAPSAAQPVSQASNPDCLF